MKLIYRPRQTGRTTELIKQCAAYNYAIIVCPTRVSADYIFQKSKELGENIPLPICISEFCTGRFNNRHVDAFLFDDLDSCLRVLAKGVPIDSVVFEEAEDEMPLHCNDCRRCWKCLEEEECSTVKKHS